MFSRKRGETSLAISFCLRWATHIFKDRLLYWRLVWCNTSFKFMKISYLCSPFHKDWIGIWKSKFPRIQNFWQRECIAHIVSFTKQLRVLLFVCGIGQTSHVHRKLKQNNAKLPPHHMKGTTLAEHYRRAHLTLHSLRRISSFLADSWRGVKFVLWVGPLPAAAVGGAPSNLIEVTFIQVPLGSYWQASNFSVSP